MEVRAEKGDKGFWDVARHALRQSQDLEARGPNTTSMVKMAAETGASADKVKNAIADHDAQEGDRRGQRPRRGLPGQRHAALLHQRPPPRRRAAVREVREDHRRGDHEGAGPRRQGHASRATSTTRSSRTARARPSRRRRTSRKSLPTNDPARGNTEREGHHPRVERLPVPVLRARRADGRAGHEGLRRQIKFVWHDLPLPMHPDAPLAAQAAREAYKQKGPSAFWTMHDKMFGNQQKIKRDDLDGYAKELEPRHGQVEGRPRRQHPHEPRSRPTRRPATTTASAARPRSSSSRDATSGYFINGAQPYASSASSSSARSPKRSSSSTRS